MCPIMFFISFSWKEEVGSGRKIQRVEEEWQVGEILTEEEEKECSKRKEEVA